jgi:hypothetical protein
MVVAVKEELQVSRPSGSTVQYVLIDPTLHDREGKVLPPSWSWVMERNLDGVLRKGSRWPTRELLSDIIEKYPKMAAGIREILDAENAMALQEVDVLGTPATHRCRACGFEAKSNFGLKSHQRSKHEGVV